MGRRMVVGMGALALGLLFWGGGVCLRGAEGNPVVGPGTAEMAALLARLNEKADPMAAPFFSRERAERLAGQLMSRMSPGEEAPLRAQYANELLNAGDTEKALAEFDRVEELVARNPSAGDSSFRMRLRVYRAVSQLRLGEQENCIGNHNASSCLAPIRPEAVHRLTRGSRAGVATLTEVLSKAPSNHYARWLLNVGYMTLGEHPEKVPSRWLIPQSVLDSGVAFPRFPNVAGKLGLELEGLAGGVVAEDFDNDGDIDLMISKWGLGDPLRYFRNDGNGRFTETTREAGIGGLVGGLNMVQADYDNDGLVDVLVLRGGWMMSAGRYPNSLLRNLGNGVFEDVTKRAGMLSFHPTQTAAWLDFNNDGWLDLFIGNETTEGEVHPCELYRNRGDGTFVECAAAAGVDYKIWVKGVAAGDYDGDGRVDLYLSSRDSRNVLLRNEGPAPEGGEAWRFRDVTEKAGVGSPEYSFPTWFFDYDNDGRLDLFVSGYRIRNAGDVAADYLGLPHNAERARLYWNKGDGTFADVTKETGLYKVLHAMGSNFGDLDNDGWLDFYIGTGDPNIGTIIPNRMFWNDGGKRFQEVTAAGGFGHLQKGHAVVFADFDNDGDQDVYESIGGAYTGDVYRSVLFENPGTTNRWIGFKLEGVKANRSGIGSRIQVTVATGAGGGEKRNIFKVVNSGGSFGANSLRQQVGIGQATEADVEIRWAGSGTVQRLEGVAAGRYYRVREGAAKAEPMEVKAVKLGGETLRE